MLVIAVVLRLVWCLLAVGGAQVQPPPLQMRPVKELVVPRRPGGALPSPPFPPKVIPPCDSVTYPGQLCLHTRCDIITVMVKGAVRFKATCSPVGAPGFAGYTQPHTWEPPTMQSTVTTTPKKVFEMQPTENNFVQRAHYANTQQKSNHFQRFDYMNPRQKVYSMQPTERYQVQRVHVAPRVQYAPPEYGPHMDRQRS